MSRISLYEYIELLENCDYIVDPIKLKEITCGLLLTVCPSIDDKKKRILADLKDDLTRTYSYETSNVSIDRDEKNNLNYLSIDCLKFSIDDNFELILVEESWRDNNVHMCENYEIIIGHPSDENILSVVKLFKKEGRGEAPTNPSMKNLLII